QPVFEGETALKVVFAHVSQTVKPLSELNPEISDELEAIIMKCLAKKPEDRFQTAEALYSALNQLQLKEWTQEQAVVWWSDAEQVVLQEPGFESASNYMKATTILPVNA
ncbi:MAG: hypothetical protein ABIK07_23275, partial [Planctomycetota bacterium]